MLTAAVALAGVSLGAPAWAETPQLLAQATAPTPPAPPRSWARYTNAREVQLRDVAGYVVVRPEDRTDVMVSISNTGPISAPELRTSGSRLVIDGNLRRRVRSCRVGAENAFSVEVSRIGRVADADLPTIELRVPRHVALSVSGAVRLRVARSDSLELHVSGCGDADVERVDGAADIATSGALDLRLYDAGEVSIAMAGAGDVTLGVAREGLALSIAGAGDFLAQHVDGPTNVAIQGAGDVTIRDGRATTLSIAIAGAGDVVHGGSADRLDAVILGGGDVRVREVSGPVSRRVFGGGEVVVGR